MKWYYVLSVLLVAGLVTGCDNPLNEATADHNSAAERAIITASNHSQPGSQLKATGGFSALWQGCGDNHDGGDQHDGESHDNLVVIKDHEDEGCQGNRPAREFNVQFNAQSKNWVKGNVTFQGLGEDEGIDFEGSVTWITAGRQDHELYFGGAITEGTVDRNCFLFSVRDNGEGRNADADQLQYRLYGSGHGPCHEPDHLPQGYPIVVYEGNIQVH
ncbi:MAG: hypothetical protein ACQETE_10110 [Bacteroidota bacterium]